MKLKEFKDLHNLKNIDLAKALNCSCPYITFLLQGKYIPSKTMMHRIMAFTRNQVTPIEFYLEDQNAK